MLRESVQRAPLDPQGLARETMLRNLRVSGIMMLVLIVFELFMIAYAAIFMDLHSAKSRAYLYHYCFLLATCIVFLVIVRAFQRREDKKIGFVNAMTYLFAAIIVVWGASISVLDAESVSQCIVLLSIMMGICGNLLLPNKVVIPVILGECAAFFLFMLAKKMPVDSGLIVNIAIFAVLAYLLAAERYRGFARDYAQQTEILRVNNQLQQMNKRLDTMRRTDELTGLLNRSAFNERLEESVKNAFAQKNYLHMFMYDIDDFKVINDTFGHRVGDECLKLVSEAFVLNLGNETVYRYGGEEFAVILTGGNPQDAVKAGEQVRSAIAAIRLKQCNVKLTISGGLFSRIPQAGDDPDKYIIHADRNLYAAKRAGKNRLFAGETPPSSGVPEI